MQLAARWALIGGERVGATTVELGETGIIAVRPHRPGDPSPADGLLIPGLVNAHVHLELAHARGRVPGGAGFGRWFEALARLERSVDPHEAMAQAAREMVETGTAAVVDHAGGDGTAPIYVGAGIGGIVQRELVGLAAERQAALLACARRPHRRWSDRPPLVERWGPHALYSAQRPVLRAAFEADGGGHPASIHLAEDPAHLRFLKDGSGPFAETLARLGIDTCGFEPWGRGPVAILDEEGWLDRAVLVHGVHLQRGEVDLLASRRRPVVLCPRSNLHIGGVLPPVRALVGRSVPLALGTDSSASCPDLDLLGEVRILVERFPEIPLDRWLHAATAGGAEAFGLRWAGRLAPNTSPGGLLVHPERPWEARRWLFRPGRNPCGTPS